MRMRTVKSLVSMPFAVRESKKNSHPLLALHFLWNPHFKVHTEHVCRYGIAGWAIGRISSRQFPGLAITKRSQTSPVYTLSAHVQANRPHSPAPLALSARRHPRDSRLGADVRDPRAENVRPAAPRPRASWFHSSYCCFVIGIANTSAVLGSVR